jgi:hypothetical protein
MAWEQAEAMGDWLGSDGRDAFRDVIDEPQAGATASRPGRKTSRAGLGGRSCPAKKGRAFAVGASIPFGMGAEVTILTEFGQDQDDTWQMRTLPDPVRLPILHVKAEPKPR